MSIGIVMMRTAPSQMNFFMAMAKAGWLGIAMPEEFGGSGLGVIEATLLMQEVAYAGAMSAASAIHINIFGPHAIVVHGSAEQKARWLPGLISGEWISCFGVTEARRGTRYDPNNNPC